MGLSAHAYSEAMASLLPSGPVWSEDPATPLRRLLRGLAVEFSRVDARAEDLREEAQPAATEEALEDWERVAGLPDPCAVIPTTLAARRAALVARLSLVGAPTPANIATAIEGATGVTVEIDENVLPVVGELHAGSLLTGYPWAHTFFVRAGPTTVTYFAAGMPLGPLADWGDALIECIANRLKPAHTRVLITYEV